MPRSYLSFPPVQPETLHRLKLHLFRTRVAVLHTPHLALLLGSPSACDVKGAFLLTTRSHVETRLGLSFVIA